MILLAWLWVLHVQSIHDPIFHLDCSWNYVQKLVYFFLSVPSCEVEMKCVTVVNGMPRDIRARARYIYRMTWEATLKYYPGGTAEGHVSGNIANRWKMVWIFCKKQLAKLQKDRRFISTRPKVPQHTSIVKLSIKPNTSILSPSLLFEPRWLPTRSTTGYLQAAPLAQLASHQVSRSPHWPLCDTSDPPTPVHIS